MKTKPQPTPARPKYVIELSALGDDSRPAAVRLRRLLKAALRCYRLRCTGLRTIDGEVTANAITANAENAQTHERNLP
jgi:hypothetical protein